MNERFKHDADSVRRRQQLGPVPAARIELALLGELRDVDLVELGCGSPFLSAGFGRAGAKPIGVDLSPAGLRPPGGAISATACPARPWE